jgi:regulatory protein
MHDLIEEDFLNEERFARSYARGKFRIKQWGRVRIQNQLKLKAISDYCIRKAMTEIDEEEYLSTLEAVLAKETKRLASAKLNAYKLTNKLYQKGTYLGYESNLIQEVLGRK